MSKQIVISASRDGFERLAEWLEDYARELPKRAEEIIDSMLSKGEAYAFFSLQHIETGETLNSIMGYRNGNKGVLLVGGNAIWIEFGTGVVANAGNAPHPKAEELGMMPWGTYTWYGNLSGLPHGADPNGWWYYGDDGQVHHTYGIPSNRFFYNTAQMLRRQCPDIAKEIFANE